MKAVLVPPHLVHNLKVGDRHAKLINLGLNRVLEKTVPCRAAWSICDLLRTARKIKSRDILVDCLSLHCVSALEVNSDRDCFPAELGVCAFVHVFELDCLCDDNCARLCVPQHTKDVLVPFLGGSENSTGLELHFVLVLCFTTGGFSGGQLESI